MRKLRKILSAILVVVLCLQIIAPGTVAIGATPLIGNNAAMSAAEGVTLPSQNNDLEVAEIDAAISANDSTEEILDSKIVTPIMGEVEELRTENTKHYRHKDGTYTAAIYSEPIHYMDSTGSWQDIDNTLTLNSKRKSASGKATYTPAASSLDIRIPQDFADNQMLTIGKDGYTVGMRIKTSDNTATMSRSSATASSKVTSAKAVINNSFESMETASISPITDNSDSDNFAVESANKEKMKLDKKVSAVNYNDVLDGADLQYVITPSKVKENIIVNEAQDSYVYQFELELDGLIPVAQENGSIKLYENKDDDEALLTIETPYMYDANEETSFDVTMSLNGNILTVTANAEWINDENRKFPVIIDPTFSTNASTFYDATANKNTPIMNFDTYKFLYAGNGTLNLRRTYLKFTLPKLPEGSVVTESNLTLIQHDVNQGSSSMKLFAFDLTGLDSWSESSITWNNQPVSTEKNAAHDDISIKNLDYVSFKTSNVDGQAYVFNITKAVKNWYEGRTNNGLMITNSDETTDSQAVLYSSDHDTASLHPSVTVIYNNNIGLEDYWSYETVDMCRSGTLYANPYNGSVTYAHSDLNMTGNLLPISISHIHNNNTDSIYSTVYSGMNVGKKYHLNIQEILIKESSTKYKHYDGDGTLHYYISNGGKITHEYNPTQTLTISGSEYIISDAQDNKKYFNSAGQLYKLVDKNGNTQTFTFSGNLITKVTDPVGRTATLEYNSYGQLISITDPAGRVTTYTYSSTSTSANLTKITYPDGKTTSFTYSSNNITKVTAYDSSYCTLTYHYQTYRGYRVSTIGQRDKNAQVTNYSTFRYVEANESGIASGNTVVNRYFDSNKSEFDGSRTYLFDTYGRVTSVTNEDYQTQYAVYGSDANTTSFNKITDSSELLTISTNELKNHGFESGNEYWSALQTASGSWGYDDVVGNSSLGNNYMQIESTSSTGTFEIGQDFTATAGQTYTVSVDINIPDSLELNGNNGVAFGLVYCVDGTWYNASSRWLGSTSGWERFTHTVTLPNGSISNCHVFLELVDAQGIVRFDNVQVERSGGARSYNLVENSDFSKGTGSSVYGWTPSGTQSVDGVQYVADAGRNFYMMTGSDSKYKEIYQKVYVNVNAGDSLIIGGKVAAYATKAASGISDSRKFEITAYLYDANGSRIKTVTIPFDPNVSQERQVKAAYVPLEKDCKYLNFYFRYYKQTDSLTIDDAFVYVDSYGEHYTYDETSGLTSTVYNDEGKVTCYSYDNNDISEITQFTSIERAEEIEENTNLEPEIGESVATYSYDDNHNVTTTTNNIGTRIEYEYNDAGQVTNQTTIYTDENGEEITMTETFAYYQNGNYIKGHTDASDVTTLYVYDNDESGENITKGLLTSVDDSVGNTTTYTYDPNTDELLSTSGEAEPSVPSTTSFTYENYLPQTITKNGTTYSYEYDSQNRVTSSKVGTQTLATNSYNDRQMLSQVTYANNAYYTPVYDSRDRLVGDSWNGTQISEYYYNDNDRLSKVVDKVTNTSYQYDYAFYDLPLRVTGSDGTQTTYDYNRSGSLARLTFSDDNVNIYSGKYYTNEKGMPEDVVIDTLDNTLIHYNYDDFGRVESYSYGPVIRTIKYIDGTTNGVATTSNQIEEIIDETRDGKHLQVYYFEYNDDGSFYLSYEGVEQQSFDYFYDGLGRVIENFTSDDLYTYSYDAAGNITSVESWYEPIHTFTYDNENWKDQLTAYDGKTITYDANGNPLSYDGYNYTWQRGTQLASITGNGKNISYVYDSQGHRVQKTVDGVTTNYLYSGDLLMRQTDGTNTIDFQYDASGNVVGFVYNGVPYYYLRNLLNDVSGIVDGDGNVVAKYRYDAYGNIIYSTGDMAEINPIRYRGYYYDTETNWYYLQSRYYNPEWCRFISPDSLFIAGDAITGNNMYAYCNGDPVSYIDNCGTEAEENTYDWLGNAIRVGSKVVSIAILPETVLFFAVVNTTVLPTVKEQFGEDFAKSDFMQETGIPLLSAGATGLLPLFSGEETVDIPTGLRHIMPANMALGAPWAGYFLGFETSTYGKGLFKHQNYTTVEGKYMWQSEVGYSWIYDYFFSLGGPIERYIYKFKHDEINYVIWCWKGDYWNLGAGAEIGIYYTDNDKYAENNFYLIDENLTVHTRMIVKYRWLFGSEIGASTLIDFHQTNWWVTMFTPAVQHPRVDRIDVELYVRFTGENYYGLMESFYNTYNDKNEDGEWSEISILDWATKSKPSGHESHEVCGLNPAVCECICPLGNTIVLDHVHIIHINVNRQMPKVAASITMTVIMVFNLK